MQGVKLNNINKIYPNGVQAVYDFNLEIEDGEFVVFVGPSGCGKSTTLRMICGLEEISSGDLLIDGQRVNDLSPKDRDIAMVFQNYALYGHMSVYHNMAFSLTLRGVSSDIIHEKVMDVARRLQLVEYLNRKPKQLSGGQRQRVAIGRAMVRDPKIYLLDEPLSNLDAKLRGETRKWLKKLHNQVQLTFIYVTHDQVEAMTVADKIVVMSHGYIQQVGSPLEVYNNPKNVFVAEFIGTPPMNILRGKLNNDMFIYGDSSVKLSPEHIDLLNSHNIKSEVILGIRPEDISITDKLDYTIDTKVDMTEYLGSSLIVTTMVNGQKLLANVDDSATAEVGQNISLSFGSGKVKFFHPETEDVLK